MPWYDSSMYGVRVQIPYRLLDTVPRSGQCEREILAVCADPFVYRQLIKIDADNLAKELREYGCWNEVELRDHAVNCIRFVWLACCDLNESRRQRATVSR